MGEEGLRLHDSSPPSTLLGEENPTRPQRPSGFLWSAQRSGQSHCVLLGSKIQRARRCTGRVCAPLALPLLFAASGKFPEKMIFHEGRIQSEIQASSWGAATPTLRAPRAGSAAMPPGAQRHKHWHEHCHGGGSAHPRSPPSCSRGKGEDTTTDTHSDEQGSSRSLSRAGHGLPSQLPSLLHLGQELFRAEIGF